MDIVYEFEAHICMEPLKVGETKQHAADRLLEYIADFGVACSLHEPRDDEITALRAEVEQLQYERSQLEHKGNGCRKCGDPVGDSGLCSGCGTVSLLGWLNLHWPEPMDLEATKAENNRLRADRETLVLMGAQSNHGKVIEILNDWIENRYAPNDSPTGEDNA